MKTNRKIMLIGTIISGIISFIYIIIPYFALLYIKYKWKIEIDTKDAASIGFIGNADGPTSILLSSMNHTIVPVISILLTIAGTIYLIKTRKNEKKII